MDWDKLRIFHAVSDAGSFTHAAESLKLSQSAISRQISGLEYDLKVPLFYRHARGLVMTEQGETLYQTVHDVLLKLDLVQNKLADSTKHPAGNLRVTTTVGLGVGWLSNCIHEFKKYYPDVQLDLVFSNEALDLGMRKADCAIRFGQPHQPDLIQRKLFTVHYHIYASPDYIRNYGEPGSLAELDNHHIITFGGDSTNYFFKINWLEFAGLSDRSKRNSTIKVNNLFAIRKMVEAGVGIAVLPDYIVGEKSQLVQLMQNVDVLSLDTFFCYPEEMRSSARLKAFRDFLISKARSWKY